MRSVGLHVRIIKNLAQLLMDVQVLGVDTFQCFLIQQDTNRHLEVDQKDQNLFLDSRKKFKTLYVHASYWINLCGKNTDHTVHLLEREIALAKRLEFNAIIIHPGAATGWSKKEGIEQFARLLNPILQKEKDLIFILENTAHGNMTIGSDIHDFSLILEQIDYPEKIKLCIDTAHAYAYGYDIADTNGMNEFISSLEKAAFLQRIALIHLNDSMETRGAKKDKHAAPGDGLMGIAKLVEFARMPALEHVPIMFELPDFQLAEQKAILDKIMKELS